MYARKVRLHHGHPLRVSTAAAEATAQVVHTTEATHQVEVITEVAHLQEAPHRVQVTALGAATVAEAVVQAQAAVAAAQAAVVAIAPLAVAAVQVVEEDNLIATTID